MFFVVVESSVAVAVFSVSSVDIFLDAEIVLDFVAVFAVATVGVAALFIRLSRPIAVFDVDNFLVTSVAAV